MASKILQNSLNKLYKEPVEGFYCELVKDENLFEWKIYLEGPKDTPYEGGIFQLIMSFTHDFPMSPPKLRFISDFWHPNVYPDGKVCISILHPPGDDPMSGELAAERWLPTQSVSSIMLSVISMLGDPNISSPANVDASVEWRDKRSNYISRCKRLCEKANKEAPSDISIPHPDSDPVQKQQTVAKIRAETIGFDFYDDDDVIDDDDDDNDDDDDYDDNDDDNENNNENSLNNTNIDPKSFDQEMLTPGLRKALTKQGYRLLGTHSGVKLCRWTKAMLRGRGGCYKHTFYGISSFQCMEMTPSLACANKCVFCWRHHKNPVGTKWKWSVDSPEFLIESAMAQHQSMIKEAKGVPGVQPERFKEAMTIKHCALSLVGEPIIYPYINEFVGMLHDRKISTFLVTNAQFPDRIRDLKPVTQLYVSIDAATKESLQKIDRPIFPDFWERFLSCIEELSKKGQRTVFRLTLVKEWNMEEIKNYSDLIAIGKPDFVEIKGVTYCGNSGASSLRMTNVPFHHEVVRFGNQICEMEALNSNYQLACEHEHSCCILLANKQKFLVNGRWNTWIDYDAFNKLSKSSSNFTSIDYMFETPSWALFGSDERGFDPEDIRFRRKSKPPTHGC
eukprot:TRINITY_DN2246_c1_g1_i3.p1 TRINITY_DN2246_c1_g1~~TRINITY_DN2246_c1_g1_i3.p1  ORF type:complete len:619 (-),score=256.87 TRINITY_DN2246_c1_g1_i3:78-1934(-)